MHRLILFERSEAIAMRNGSSQRENAKAEAAWLLAFAAAALAFFILFGSPAKAEADPLAGDASDSGVVALAETVGPFAIEGGSSGADYSFENNVLIVKTSTALTVSMASPGATTNARIVIAAAATNADVTVDGVSISLTDTSDRRPPIKVESGAELSLTLLGKTTLKTTGISSDNGAAALEVGVGASVVIDGTGALECRGAAGAGIGGGGTASSSDRNAGSVTINGGTIEAYGGIYAAGIGGGHGGGDGGTITINGGTVKAVGQNGAAGIGGACWHNQDVGNAGTIAINGGTVDAAGSVAYGSLAGNGIGGGAFREGIEPMPTGTVAITGGKIKAASIAAPIKADAAISGGLFAAGDATAGTVYDVAPSSGHAVAANPDPGTQAAYPCGVYSEGVSSVDANPTVSFEYDGQAADPSAIGASAARGGADASDALEYSYQVLGETLWTDGLPARAGAYTVKATLPAVVVDETYYPAQDASFSLEIRKKALFAAVREADPRATKTYDASPWFSNVSLELGGVVGADRVTATAIGAAATLDVGRHAFTASQVTLSGTDAASYALDPSAVSGSVTIAQHASLDLRASAALLKHQPDHTVSIVLSGVSGYPVDGGGMPAFAVFSSTSNGLSSATIQPGSDTLVLVADDTANDAPDTVVVSVTGMRNYADSTVTVAVSYADKPTAAVSGVVAATDLLYTGTGQTGFTGAPTATYEPLRATYAGPFAVTYEGTGVTSYGPTDEEPAAAGTYAVTVAVPYDEPSCAGSAVLNFEIGKAPLAVAARDHSIVYGDPLSNAGVDYGGFVNGEGEGVLGGSLSWTSDYEQFDDAGGYTLTPSGLTSGNYEIAFAPAALTVERRALTAEVDPAHVSASKVYDGTAAFAGVTLALDGALPGDDVAASASGAAADALAEQGKAFAAGGVSLKGAKAHNYALSLADVSGTVAIAKAPLAIRALDATMRAGDPLPALSYRAEGLVDGDSVAEEPLLAVAGDASQPGTYPIVATGGRVDNHDCYEVSYEFGELTVLAVDSPDGPGGGATTGGGADGAGAKLLPRSGDDVLPLAAAVAGLAIAALGAAAASRRFLR